MKYYVLESFRVKTSQGEMELQTGQVITLPYDLAIRLLNEEKIQPAEKVAYRIYSEILESYLWIVNTDQDMHSLRGQGISEAIYTNNEIEKLKSLDKDSLKVIHQVKDVFEGSKIEEVRPKESNDYVDR